MKRKPPSARFQLIVYTSDSETKFPWWANSEPNAKDPAWLKRLNVVFTHFVACVLLCGGVIIIDRFG
ncbi:MAG: hypothetical protein ACRD2S_09175, partial [Terriglobales bacterium]